MNVRLTLLLVVVLGLVAGAVFITRSLSTKEPVEREPQLFRVNERDIIAISVVHNEVPMEYARQNDEWVIKDGKDTPVFIDKWSGKTLLLSGPRCRRAVVEEIDDPAKYGLESPPTRITLTITGGTLLEFHLGDSTPNEENWYARLVGSNRLCTLPAVYGEVVSGLVTDPPYTPTPEPET